MTDSTATTVLEAIRGPYDLGRWTTVTALGNGHINRTFLVSDGDRRCVAQQINTHVFPRPADLVENANQLAAHLQSSDTDVRVVRHLPGNNKRYLHGSGQDIRVLEFIPGSRSIEIVESPQQAWTAAHAFAAFSRRLVDFETNRLTEVIPNFHHPAVRFDQFLHAMQNGKADRANECKPEIELALSSEARIRGWQKLTLSLSLRTCHNDCKINNILFDRNGDRILAVIDLDTCMPGRLMTDFGDLVRSCTSPEAEDSTALEQVEVRPEIYAALLDGYLAGMGSDMSTAERDSLLQGAMMICFVQGLRFLTDFLAGDPYFGAAHRLHNLDRARNQFKLYDSLVSQQHDLARLLNRKPTGHSKT